VSDPLPLFAEESASPETTKTAALMTASQRRSLKELFGQLGLTTAREQFEVVEEVTGQRISAVAELLAANAQALIYQLPARIQSQKRIVTGNDWADREEDTWIDKL
jgi:hypothetical protein